MAIGLKSLTLKQLEKWLVMLLDILMDVLNLRGAEFIIQSFHAQVRISVISRRARVIWRSACQYCVNFWASIFSIWHGSEYLLASFFNVFVNFGICRELRMPFKHLSICLVQTNQT